MSAAREKQNCEPSTLRVVKIIQFKQRFEEIKKATEKAAQLDPYVKALWNPHLKPAVNVLLKTFDRIIAKHKQEKRVSRKKRKK